MKRLRAAHPGKVVEARAQDEARLGLKPMTRRVWRLRGCRPRTCGRTKYEWVYVYGFVRPQTGDSFTVLLPRVNTARMGEALAAFAARADPEGTKIRVLVVDNAGWHVAKRLAAPGNVRLHFLPPRTPELQPVEPFWVLVREAAANDTFDRLGDLTRVIRRRCKQLAGDVTTVKGAVGFHWAIKLEK